MPIHVARNPCSTATRMYGVAHAVIIQSKSDLSKSTSASVTYVSDVHHGTLYSCWMAGGVTWSFVHTRGQIAPEAKPRVLFVPECVQNPCTTSSHPTTVLLYHPIRLRN